MLRAAEQDRPDVRRKRAAWRSRAARIDAGRLVFLDEVGAHTALTRLYGRAPRGRRLVDAVPQAHWRQTTLIGAIRREGPVAALVFEGAADEAACMAYVERVLLPALRPGDIVALDNLQAHKAGAVARALRKAKVGVWFLPPYSPDLNPIEKVWAKVKGWLRQAGARTTEALWQAIAAALRAVTPQDCQGCFESCGYHATPECKAL